MGGLRQYMPITCGLMWIATLAIAGIPPFAGFFSKDEILGAVFARAQHSTLAEASLVRHSGQRAAVRRLRARARRGAHDRDLHDADDALHLPRPEPHRRDGASAPARGAVGHDRPARGARRAERRSAAGSTCRRSFRSARSACCEHWLEPVVGARGAARHARRRGARSRTAPSTSLIGVAGRDRASSASRSPCVRLKPATLVPEGAGAARSRASSACSRNKYYVDETLRRGDRAARRRHVAQPALARHRRRPDRRAARQRQRRRSSRGSFGWLGLAARSRGRSARTRGCSSSACSRCSAPSPSARRDARLPALRSATTAGSFRRCCVIPLVGALVVLLARRRREGEDEVATARPRCAALHRAARVRCSSSCSRSASGGLRPGERRLAAASSTCRGFRRGASRFTLGVDGIALMMVLLTTFLMPLASLGSWTSVRSARCTRTTR